MMIIRFNKDLILFELSVFMIKTMI
jgi:hypothetical protein